MQTKNRRRMPILIAVVGFACVAAAVATAFAPSRPTPASTAKAAVAGSHRVGGVRSAVLPARLLRHR
ncbi:hypothetical protein GCM10023195_35050 [Actinoallomurus liliacearum]|uniref:Uncharacterized protein n=1 Tax=Actinoallomurus liliacearum TaxID=1080073 RepID=A0ABP8TM88_9ACTN